MSTLTFPSFKLKQIILQLMSTQEARKDTHNSPNFNPSSAPYPEPLQVSKVQSVSSHISTGTALPELLQHFQSYSPASKLFQSLLPQLHASPSLKLKKYKQSIYYGQLVNNKKHGRGIMLYNDGRIYEGNWMSDYKYGEGYEKFANQCVYQGEFINGKPQGIGRYSWPNGQYYEGQWVNGMKHGSGMWRGAKGDSYIGEWKHGKADGYGVHTWINGDRYEGQFKQCLKHGEGIQKFNNGDIYKGNYVNGKPSGYGQYYWQNGSYFKGEFLNGLRNGSGIWKKGPGHNDKYQGQYENDKKNGYGIFTWSTGNVYKGNYQSDVRNGYGQMYWSDGSYYKGEWRSGVQNGNGQIYIPGEGYKKGIFQDNVLIVVEKQSHHAFQEKTENQSINVNQNMDQNQQNKQYHNIKEYNMEAEQQDPQSVSHTQGKQKNMPSKLSFRSRGYSSKNRKRQPKIINQNNFIRNQPPQYSHSEHQSYHTSQLNSNTSQINAKINKYPKQFKTISYQNNNANYNPNHPLLQKQVQSRLRQQKYVTLQRKAVNMRNVSSKQKQRILHSSFYMHKLHTNATNSANPNQNSQGNINDRRAIFNKNGHNVQRANTSINGSKVDGEIQSGYDGSQDFNVSNVRPKSIVDEIKHFSRGKPDKNGKYHYY